jgi:hypothetical protein
MNHTHPCTEESYLYTLQVTLCNDASQTDVIDIYCIPHIFIRTIRLTDSKFLVNERPFYFHGANAHEDSDIRGKVLIKLFLLNISICMVGYIVIHFEHHIIHMLRNSIIWLIDLV